jgi:hypothetical protein
VPIAVCGRVPYNRKAATDIAVHLSLFGGALDVAIAKQLNERVPIQEAVLQKVAVVPAQI